MSKARDWLLHGGGGHADGEAGIRALIVNGEALVEFLEAYDADARTLLSCGHPAACLTPSKVVRANEELTDAMVAEGYSFTGGQGEPICTVCAEIAAMLTQAESIVRTYCRAEGQTVVAIEAIRALITPEGKAALSDALRAARLDELNKIAESFAEPIRSRIRERIASLEAECKKGTDVWDM